MNIIISLNSFKTKTIILDYKNSNRNHNVNLIGIIYDYFAQV